MTKRGKIWIDFSMQVLRHIEDDTIRQYGDEGEDQLTNYTAEDCRKQVDKYQTRRGKTTRPGDDMLDILKEAHYLAEAWTKMNKKQEGGNQK